MTPEGKVKAWVKRAFADLNVQCGGRVYQFMPVQNGMGVPGLDFYYCVNGWFVAVETKAQGKKPTARQELTIAAIKKSKGLVYVVDDKDSIAYMLTDVMNKCFPSFGVKQIKTKQGFTLVEPDPQCPTSSQRDVRQSR